MTAELSKTQARATNSVRTFLKINLSAKVFDSETNEQVFQDVILANWEPLFQGINMSVFTYGQTSSGKTWTMKGDELDSKKHANNGLIIHSLRALFDENLIPSKYCC